MPISKDNNSHQRVEQATETLRRAERIMDQAKETIKQSKQTVQASRKIQLDRDRQQREKTNDRTAVLAAADEKKSRKRTREPVR